MTNEQKKQILDEIQASNKGVLRPDDVVRVAAAPDHPLHDQFNWDDRAAAHSFRVDQARNLIHSVRMFVTSETHRFSTPMYLRDPRAPSTEQGYLSLPRVRSERDLAVETVAAEFDRVRSILTRARDVAIGVGLMEEARRAQAMLAMFSINAPIVEEAQAAT